MFALNDPARIAELVTEAGFGEPEIEQVPVEWPYSTPEVHWEKTMKLAAPIARAVDELDDDERERLRLTVADSGPGFGRSPHRGRGVGLSSIEARLRHLYGDAHQVRKGVAGARGAVVDILVPWRES